jgi:hypothetical protein
VFFHLSYPSFVKHIDQSYFILAVTSICFMRNFRWSKQTESFRHGCLKIILKS